MQSLTQARIASQDELLVKRKELRVLEKTLAEEEWELEKEKRLLVVFEDRYREQLGPRYAEWDDLKATILELKARSNPDSAELNEEAALARRQAEDSIRECSYIRPQPKKASAEEEVKFEPTDVLKKRFRDMARRFHPDLTTDPEERNLRHAWMARVNQAYRQMDVETLEALLDEWDLSHTPPDPETARIELIKVIKKIAAIKNRLSEIKAAMHELSQVEMYRLHKMVECAWARGEDMLLEMAGEIDEKITALKFELQTLTKEDGLSL